MIPCPQQPPTRGDASASAVKLCVYVCVYIFIYIYLYIYIYIYIYLVLVYGYHQLTWGVNGGPNFAGLLNSTQDQ